VSLLVLLIGIISLYSDAGEISTNPQTVTEGTGQESVFKMSLDELLDAKISVPAALTKLTSAEAPASITVITAENIKYTPTRNIYDLIEVYVPGAIWMNFEDGPQLGVRGIMGFISLAELNANSNNGIKENLENARKIIFQSKDLTKQLLTLSKGGEPVKRTISISELIKSSVCLVLSGSNVKSELCIPDNLWNVDADKEQLNQVFNNIVINA
tara:strand:- start:435 stop:1073 length:639 start_codon:yes stop_codon:yes gene_type:complete